MASPLRDPCSPAHLCRREYRRYPITGREESDERLESRDERSVGQDERRRGWENYAPRVPVSPAYRPRAACAGSPRHLASAFLSRAPRPRGREALRQGASGRGPRGPAGARGGPRAPGRRTGGGGLAGGPASSAPSETIRLTPLRSATSRNALV